MHIHTVPQIVKIESRFITTIDVVHYLALLERLLTCTHSHTRSRTHIGLHQLTYNHTIAHSLTVTHMHTFTHNHHIDTQMHTYTHNIHIYSKIQIFITLIHMHTQTHVYNTIQSHARTHTHTHTLRTHTHTQTLRTHSRMCMCEREWWSACMHVCMSVCDLTCWSLLFMDVRAHT